MRSMLGLVTDKDIDAAGMQAPKPSVSISASELGEVKDYSTNVKRMDTLKEIWDDIEEQYPNRFQ